MLAFLREHPRLVPSDDGMGLSEVLAAFVSRRLERRFPGHPYVWPEYGAYLGWPVVAGVFWLAWRRFAVWRGWFALLGLFVLLMTGNRGGGLSPHELLHELPIFRSLHVPSRFGIVVTLFGVVLAGAALQALADSARASSLRPRLRSLALGLLALVAVASLVDVLTFGQWQMSRFRDLPSQAPPRPVFGLSRAPWHEGPSFPRRRIGTLACYEPNGVKQGKVRAGLPSEVFLADGASGEARITRWTPARVQVEAQLLAPGKVVLNQNDHLGWQVEGGLRASHEGMPAIALPEGRHDLVFVYRPSGLGAGLAASLLGLLGLVLLAWLARPERLSAARARVRAWLCVASA
jgi:hypothetical protein